MSSFREKFSVDYLRRADSETAQSQQKDTSVPAGLSPDMEEALLSVGGKVATVLSKAQDKKARVFDILKELKDVRIDTLIPVVDHLMERGYVARVAQDTTGNDLLELTDRGQKLV